MDRFAGKKIQDFLSFANAPEYDAIGAREINNRKKEKEYAMFTEAKVAGAGMEGLGKTKAAQFNALGNIEAAKLGAEAKAHAAAASADATTSNAMMGMFGSIAGAGISALPPLGGFGGYSGTGPSAPEPGKPIYSSGEPWNGPIFGEPGSMHKI